MKRAIFPGTFDPFTIGHQSLVDRALRLVDELVISVGVNRDKKSFFPLEKRLESIRRLYGRNPNVQVMAYDSPTVDFARNVNADFIVRGIRTVNDFEYEKNIADVNRKLTGIDTLVLFAEPECAFVSSSIVRELLSCGKDVSAFVPKEIQLYEHHED
ncbi:MAG: pantetheine-phosphate adenylyltransferase [Tannerella sp.]|jgi:pantetheine-phosphate adenylyltransferase|nr:pantetheine-phosphate adenylyltransferase [Tannerella sp.]